MSVDLNNTPPPQGQGQTPPPQGTPPGQTPSSTPAQGQTTPPAQQQHSTLTGHWTEDDRAYIKKLRDEAKSANDALAEVKRKEAEVEQERLKQAGEFEKLAKQHEVRLKELEPIVDRYSRLAETIGQQIDATIKDWPKSVKALDPGKDAPVEQRLAWQASAQKIIDEMGTAQRAGAPGNSPNPPAQGQNTSSQNVEELRRRYQSQRGNPF